MRLDEYLKEQKLSQAAFGLRLNPPVTQTLVSQWVRGATRVMLEQAVQIEVLTQGAVTPRDLAEMYRLRDQQPAPA